MKYHLVLQFLDLILERLKQESVVGAMKWPTPTIEITPPGTDLVITVELAVSTRRESFSILFKSKDGINLMCIPFFGHRTLTDSADDTTLITGRADWLFHQFLKDADRLTELIWERCTQIYLDKTISEYHGRPSSAYQDVRVFYQLLGAPVDAVQPA